MTINEIINQNKRAGMSFFDGSQLRAWHSRISSVVHEGPGGIFFVTSELAYDGSCRRWSVRQFIPETDKIKTAAWSRYRNNSEAQRFASKFAKGYPEVLSDDEAVA